MQVKQKPKKNVWPFVSFIPIIHHFHVNSLPLSEHSASASPFFHTSFTSVQSFPLEITKWKEKGSNRASAYIYVPMQTQRDINCYDKSIRLSVCPSVRQT